MAVPPSVVEILVATSPTAAMTCPAEVRAVPGKGLEGDRYFEGVGTFSPHPPKPDFEITLIEKENVAAFARDSGLPFTAAHARRKHARVVARHHGEGRYLRPHQAVEG